jgi:hypothetical protein
MLQHQVVYMTSEHEKVIRLLVQKLPKDTERASLLCILVRQQKEINRLRRQLRKERGIDINMETIIANDMKYTSSIMGMPPRTEQIQIIPNENVNYQPLHADPISNPDFTSSFNPNVSKFAPFTHGFPVSAHDIPTWQNRLTLPVDEQNHAMMINTNLPFASYANVVNVQNITNPMVPSQIPRRNILNCTGEVSVPTFQRNMPFDLPAIRTLSNDNHSPCFA